MSVQYFEIGASLGTLVNVETLTDMAPNMAPSVTYRPYKATIDTGGNGRKAIGPPEFEWNWGYIYADMFDALRALIPGASANIYIRSRKESDSETDPNVYLYYQATVYWPEMDSYEFRAGKYSPFQLIFTNLVSVELPS